MLWVLPPHSQRIPSILVWTNFSSHHQYFQMNEKGNLINNDDSKVAAEFYNDFCKKTGFKYTKSISKYWKYSQNN